MNKLFANRIQVTYFVCFFLSGFCGLLYQIIWLRLAYASFGVISPVLSVVVSVFMAGLALGSALAGKYVIGLSQKLQIPAINFYAATELLIGLGAVAVPFLFQFSETLLLSSGSSDSLPYLILSALCIFFSLLPWCILMGFTYPIMLAHIKQASAESEVSFAYLYWANVSGAAIAVIATAAILIELLGLHACLWFGCALNIVAALLSLSLKSNENAGSLQERNQEINTIQAQSKSPLLPLVLLFLSGSISMAYEIVWTRSFTPILGTAIYSFALLLFVYLLCTALGSQKYVAHKIKGTPHSLPSLVIAAAITSILPTLLNGFSTESIYLAHDVLDRAWRAMLALISIAPFSFTLGYLTPQLIDDTSKGLPESAGKAYAINTIGCIFGPLLASYALLPILGTRFTSVLLALPLAAFAFYFIFNATPALSKSRQMLLSASLIGSLLVSLFFLGSYEEPRIAGSKTYRDYAASTLLWGKGAEAELLVNGRSMTNIRPFLKLMAHFPIVIHKGPVHSSLAICLGMGTTFRSLLSWDGNDVTVVELIPGVKKALTNFYPDAQLHLDQIVIDDGRRFLKRCNKKFDIITIDPPPPLEAAGSSLLYSREFCHVLKEHLNDGGILQQWFGCDEMAILSAVARSLKNEFKYVRIFQSSEGWGYHIICSDQPIEIPSLSIIKAKLSEKNIADMAEGAEEADKKDPTAAIQRIIASEIPLSEILKPEIGDLNDDKPANEYCVIRRIQHGNPDEWNSVKVRKLETKH